MVLITLRFPNLIYFGETYTLKHLKYLTKPKRLFERGVEFKAINSNQGIPAEIILL